MYRKYSLRKNYKAVGSDNEGQILGHLAFKTRDDLWLNTNRPSILLVSVNSAFHSGFEGDMKMEAFIAVIRSSVKALLTILIADLAHLKTRQLLEENKAETNCRKDADELIWRYSSLFAGSPLIYWRDLIKDDQFSLLRSEIVDLSKKDQQFLQLLKQDAETDWTHKRQALFTSKESFIEQSIEELIDQCACLQLLANLGYRYIFYPGAPHRATQYLQTSIDWIDVFLSIEKKTRIGQLLQSSS